MNNLISIIIPVYNGEHFLERCLQSLLSQTYKNLEIIVINDGSTDQTKEIIHSFTEQDRRIKPVHQHNQGVSAARNAGLSIATGDFIGFVDGDDEVYPDMYKLLITNLIKHDADISHCGFELVKKDAIIKFHDTGMILLQDKWDGVKEILAGHRVEPSACNKLYKKSVISGVAFSIDIKINEDLLFNVEAFTKAEKSVFEDVVKYRYLHNSQSASRTAFTEKKAKDMYEVAKRISNLLKNSQIKEVVDQFYTTKLLTLLQIIHQNNLQKTEFTKMIRGEVSKSKTKQMGLRAHFTKILLVKLPFLYSGARFFYDLFFTKNQKWKNH